MRQCRGENARRICCWRAGAAALRAHTAGVIDDLRASEEGRESLREFMEKSKLAWMIP